MVLRVVAAAERGALSGVLAAAARRGAVAAELGAEAAQNLAPAGASLKEQRRRRCPFHWSAAQDRHCAARARSATLALPERWPVAASCVGAARRARCRRAVDRSPSPPNILFCEIDDRQRRAPSRAKECLHILPRLPSETIMDTRTCGLLPSAEKIWRKGDWTYASMRRRIRLALVPPNPKEFDSAMLTCRLRARCGTRSMAVATDGLSRLIVGGTT
jgi:hypothetical protein